MNASPDSPAGHPTGWPAVAVIIPFYNGADFIERSVSSVFAQTVAPSEVIVVNDGSRADERERLQALQAHYPFRIVDKDNGGQGSARNAGVAACQAPCLCFLDQDDFYLPNHIEILLGAVPRDDLLFGFVYGDLYEADVDGNVIRTQLVKQHARHHPKQSIFDLLRHDMFVLPSAALVSRAAFEAVGGFDPQFRGYEDDDLFLRIFRKGYSNHFVDRAVTVWCIHTDSTSFSIRMVRSRFRYFKKLLAMFPDEPRRGRFYLRDYLMPRFGRFFVDHVVEAVKQGDENREEMSRHLAEYVGIVLANPYVSRRYKLKLKTTAWLLGHSSPGVVRFVGALTRLPVIRNLRRLHT